MTDGNIDNTLHRICSRLRADNWSADDALVLVRPHAERVGATAGHLEEKIRNAWSRYEPNERAVKRSVQVHSPNGSWDAYQKIRDSRGDRPEFTTGFPNVDRLTKGLRRQELFTVAARPGIGKTNCLISIARNLCQLGKSVLLFSTEMSYDTIWDRYIGSLEKPEEFKNHQFHVSDEFTPDVERIERVLNEILPDVFMFDHINHIGEDNEALGKFMLGLKLMARKFNIPCVVAAQLNRQADQVSADGKRVEPRLSMIKGSGTIEQVSAQVLLLSELSVTPEQVTIIGVVDKSRYGDKGEVLMRLRKNPYIFEEVPEEQTI